jgi:UDP-N-acetylglucosamine 4,6-dehydratase
MKILITGGTGSFGSRYVKHLHETTDYDITVFSRNEFEQWKQGQDYKDRVSYIIGDVRDWSAVKKAVYGQDIVVHAAALKHVRTGEVQPWETIQTNVIGTQNVSQACIRYGAKMIFLSTDKAVQPINLYGASKMAAERLVLNAGHVVTRWGNVMGSRGSVLHIFRQQSAQGHRFTITDKRTTRFIITFDECFEVVERAIKAGSGVVLPENLYGINIVDLAYAFDPDAKFSEFGLQPGEKMHEWLSYNPLISSEDCDKLTVEEIRRLIDES